MKTEHAGVQDSVRVIGDGRRQLQALVRQRIRKSFHRFLRHIANQPVGLSTSYVCSEFSISALSHRGGSVKTSKSSNVAWISAGDLALTNAQSPPWP